MSNIVLIVFNHDITEEVNDALADLKIRGYTRWLNVHGQGSEKGEPHLDIHIWPAQKVVIMTIIEDELVDPLLEKIKAIDKEAEEQGIHAFIWTLNKKI